MAFTNPHDIVSEASGWDADLNDNFALIFKNPVPLTRLAGSGGTGYANAAALPPASQHEYCIAILQDAGHGGPGIAISNGSTWLVLGTQAADVDALTDNTGSASPTNANLNALTNPANSPVSADALRDDLVTNVWPGINNNFARLNYRLGQVIEALQNAGLMDS